MRPKLLIAVLVLMLAGANCDAASICAAYCTSPASAHHPMESQPGPTIISHHIHAHHQGAKCAECPPESDNSLNEKTDCSSLVQIHALKEGYFSLDAPGGVPQLDVGDTPAYTLGLAPDGGSVLVFGSAWRIRSSTSASVPLRI
jgi:hypothetical protein